MEQATPEAMADLSARAAIDLEPAGPGQTLIQLNRLFSIMSMPSDDGLVEWIAAVEQYPVRVIGRAIDRLFAAYKYPSPPKPADLIAYIKIDHQHRQGLHIRTRLEMLATAKART